MTLFTLCEGLKPRNDWESSQSSSSCSSMHLARPKSSKGRSRPAVNGSLYTGDTDSIQRSPVSPDSAAYDRPERNLRSQSQPIMRQASQLSHDGILQMLQYAPAAPPQSLNKYRVLPSIERRQSERSLQKQVSSLSLSDDAVLQQRPEDPGLPDVIQISSSEVDKRADVHLGVCPEPPDQEPVMPKDPTSSLLLAIRAPCGRRFQQHFDPTDTLLTVRASAEVRYGANYGDASIETMDMPRRSFTGMDKTLAQCGISNRSVLCISQSDRVVEHE